MRRNNHKESCKLQFSLEVGVLVIQSPKQQSTDRTSTITTTWTVIIMCWVCGHTNPRALLAMHPHAVENVPLPSVGVRAPRSRHALPAQHSKSHSSCCVYGFPCRQLANDLVSSAWTIRILSFLIRDLLLNLRIDFIF